jgi:hypothetical protein
MSEQGRSGLDTMTPALISRRDAVQRVTALLGGIALAGGDRLLATAFETEAIQAAARQGVGAFTAADVAFLDEVAETILPATKTPGAKAAQTGAFMALMVTDAYSEPAHKVFLDGMRRIDELCQQAHSVRFVDARPEQRLALLETLDREQHAEMEARAGAPRSRAPVDVAPAGQPAHYFRMMKELALLGYFTSEIGYMQAMRYRESPGRFDPCVPFAPGDKTWANHA